jgi:hypothetical protein
MGVRNATALLTGIGASTIAQLILTGDMRKPESLPLRVACPLRYLNELGKREIKMTKRKLEL